MHSVLESTIVLNVIIIHFSHNIDLLYFPHIQVKICHLYMETIRVNLFMVNVCFLVYKPEYIDCKTEAVAK
jgi:hypothetical protein